MHNSIIHFSPTHQFYHANKTWTRSSWIKKKKKLTAHCFSVGRSISPLSPPIVHRVLSLYGTRSLDIRAQTISSQSIVIDRYQIHRQFQYTYSSSHSLDRLFPGDPPRGSPRSRPGFRFTRFSSNRDEEHFFRTTDNGLLINTIFSSKYKRVFDFFH